MTGRGRVLGIDLGERRVGLAISDLTGTLARPLAVLAVGGQDDAVMRVAKTVERLTAEEEGLASIVVGYPLKLDGSASEGTARVSAFIEALARRTGVPIVAVDERLTSQEAESRLAVREKDWRRRKEKLDAAAAAIVLQDYLDAEPPTADQS
jgi:putative Holliday junction resolvase